MLREDKIMSEDEKIQNELDQLLRHQLGPSANQVLDNHVLNPKNAGHLKTPDGIALVTGSCEDTIQIEINVKENRIADIRFSSNGCMATIACASVATELAKGKTIQGAYKITDRAIDDALGGLPKEHLRCAALASNALREAIKNYLHTKREPWKRLYRKNI